MTVTMTMDIAMTMTTTYGSEFVPDRKAYWWDSLPVRLRRLTEASAELVILGGGGVLPVAWR